MTNMSRYGGQYNQTQEVEVRHMKIDHPEFGACSVAIEDTPGFKPLDRENTAPDLLEPKIAYMWCDDGVRKPGAEDPNAEEEEAKDGEAAKADETTPLVTELKGVSP